MARGVDEVEHMAVEEHPDVLGLNGDAPFPLDVHGVEVLLSHLAWIDRSGDLQDPIRERRLAVVDMTDDGEIADVRHGNGTTGSNGARHGPSIVPAQAPWSDRYGALERFERRWIRRTNWCCDLLGLPPAPVS